MNAYFSDDMPICFDIYILYTVYDNNEIMASRAVKGTVSTTVIL